MQSFILNDGRKMAYGVYGDQAGIPLLFFHGYPGTNLMAQLAEEGALKYGFRLIAPDRPGMGDSDFQTDRKLYHYSIDILQLLNHLGIDKCGIVAISGGSPYAFQCAHDLPQKISFVASLSGWISYGRPEVNGIKIDKFFTRFEWCLRKAMPLAKLMVRAVAHVLKTRLDKALAHMIGDLPVADKQVLANPAYYEIVAKDLQNAVRQGWQGPMQDAIIQFANPAFALSDIKQPVILLHGKADTVAPIDFARILKRQLPNIFASLEMEHGGHFCAVTEQDWIYQNILRLPINQKTD
jgi:pimeloyl-ACP methyl ester carboxylesterase